VPQAVGQPVEAAACIHIEYLAVAVEVGDVGDLGALETVLDAVMARALRRGMDRAEMPGEIDLLRVGQFLLVEDHDRIAVDRILDGIAIGRLQRLRKVDAGDLGEEVGLGGRDCDAHDRLLRL
jgi:hypothetical protein